MKKIIKYVIDQKLDSIDDYSTLAQPIADNFGLDFGVAETVTNAIIEWETSPNMSDNLIDLLERKFPSIVT